MRISLYSRISIVTRQLSIVFPCNEIITSLSFDIRYLENGYVNFFRVSRKVVQFEQLYKIAVEFSKSNTAQSTTQMPTCVFKIFYSIFKCSRAFCDCASRKQAWKPSWQIENQYHQVVYHRQIRSNFGAQNAAQIAIFALFMPLNIASLKRGFSLSTLYSSGRRSSLDGNGTNLQVVFASRHQSVCGELCSVFTDQHPLFTFYVSFYVLIKFRNVYQTAITLL